MDLIISASSDNGYITHKTAERDWVYNAVRMGVAWPTDRQPAYICVFGNLFNARRTFGDTIIGPIRMIAEHEIKSLSLRDLFDKIMDCTKGLWAEEVLVDYSPANEGYVEAFRDYCNALDYSRPWPTVQAAPYADNFVFGFQLAKDWLRSGKVKVAEESKLYDQLSKFRPERDFIDGPEKIWNAINGYRYVLASFQKDPAMHNAIPKFEKKLFYSQT